MFLKGGKNNMTQKGEFFRGNKHFGSEAESR